MARYIIHAVANWDESNGPFSIKVRCSELTEPFTAKGDTEAREEAKRLLTRFQETLPKKGEPQLVKGTEPCIVRLLFVRIDPLEL